METWIFQANPARYRLDLYLSQRPAENEWLVSRYKERVQPGDRVFLWRAGSDALPAGVVAEAEVITPVREVRDDSPPEWWANPNDASAIRSRARIALRRVANRREVIKRDWWAEDPILRNHLIMRMANHTTFGLEGPSLDRLGRLWGKTGTDWSYDETIAGLWAYVATKGIPISRLPGSPISETALLIGRAVPGVYNKVMNFRFLDPEESRRGLDGASSQDDIVWKRFYSTGVGLRTEAVEAEFTRLWKPEPRVAEINVQRHVHDIEVESLANRFTLTELLARYAASRRRRDPRPRLTTAPAKRFDRDPLVTAIALTRSKFQCELPDCTVQLFVGSDGHPFVEVHHVHTLATGGEDTPENVVCLCPLHHREIHHGANAAALQTMLLQMQASRANVPV